MFGSWSLVRWISLQQQLLQQNTTGRQARKGEALMNAWTLSRQGLVEPHLVPIPSVAGIWKIKDLGVSSNRWAASKVPQRSDQEVMIAGDLFQWFKGYGQSEVSFMRKPPVCDVPKAGKTTCFALMNACSVVALVDVEIITIGYRFQVSTQNYSTVDGGHIRNIRNHEVKSNFLRLQQLWQDCREVAVSGLTSKANQKTSIRFQTCV